MPYKKPTKTKVMERLNECESETQSILQQIERYESDEQLISQQHEALLQAAQKAKERYQKAQHHDEALLNEYNKANDQLDKHQQNAKLIRDTQKQRKKSLESKLISTYGSYNSAIADEKELIDDKNGGTLSGYSSYPKLKEQTRKYAPSWITLETRKKDSTPPLTYRHAVVFRGRKNVKTGIPSYLFSASAGDLKNIGFPIDEFCKHFEVQKKDVDPASIPDVKATAGLYNTDHLTYQCHGKRTY